MKKFIKEMNVMFDANPYTDKGRVVVDYAPHCDVVIVKVMDKTEIIEIDALTEYGIMYAIMDKVKEMYDR